MRRQLKIGAFHCASLSAVILALAIAGCTTGGVARSPSSQEVQANSDENESLKTLRREVGIAGNDLLGTGRGEDGGPGAKIGVNAILWRASLDTVSFMPLASADPFGGVIITDWYSNPDAPNERFKITIYILDKRLRADAVKVSFFRQAKQGGRWVDAQVGAESARRIEDQILTRARQLRIAQAEESG